MPDSLPPGHPALATLLARASVPPRQLGNPGPGEAALDLAVAAALRAPGHGGLKPWRLALVTGEARGMPLRGASPSGWCVEGCRGLCVVTSAHTTRLVT